MSPRKANPPHQSEARARLLGEAARLFAERGYNAVTTREICAAAEVNPGAIHYHFGDKDGLYREVIYGPIAEIQSHFADFDDPALSLEAALGRFLAPFLRMNQQDDGAVMRLYLRELLDPSSVFTQTVQQHIGPTHHRLAALLARHAGCEVDTAIHQLAYGLVAMAHDYCLSRPFMEALTPGLLDDDPLLQALHSRLVGWGVVLVHHERERRRS
ncbi:MAG: TetR/AcrR family transcriptional regulator [Inhella sp.]